MILDESSLVQLYNSAVKAFPNTTKRQHATGPVQIVDLGWMPFFGMNTLFVNATAQNEDREYNTIVLFKKVNYGNGPGYVRLVDSTGMPFSMRPITEEQEVLVRCNCPDFRWRFNYYDHIDYSLYGRKAPKYTAKTNRGPANPSELPGMCKHLMKMSESMDVLF